MANFFAGQQIGVGIVRNLTFAQLTAANYVFPNSVIVIESDTLKQKVGDGSTAYNSLAYSAGGQIGSTLTTTPVTTNVITEFGDGRDIVTVCTLTDFIVGTLAGAAAALGVGNILYAYPAGQHLELVSSFSALSLTAAGTAVSGCKLGLGSVIASGAISVLSGTSTFQDRLTGTTVPTASGGGAATSAIFGATAGIGTGIALNGTGAIKNVFLNAAATWNADNVSSLKANGLVISKWTRMS